jgi:predicted RNA-binding protein with TRAM domain
VAVTDLDRGGFMDLVFACRNNGTGYRIPSVVHLGAIGTWSPSPSFGLPTTGAVDVLPVSLTDPDRGGYLSEAITPDPEDDPGSYRVLEYVSNMGSGHTGTISVLDAETGEVLAETPLSNGFHGWDISDAVSYRDHPSIRVMVAVEGLAGNPGFTLDDLWLNWADRGLEAPRVVDIAISNTTVYRGDTVLLTIGVTDDFDLPGALGVMVQHQLEGETEWKTYLRGGMSYEDDLWKVIIAPDRFVPLGLYTFRVNVTDSDDLFSGFVDLEDTLEVLPNLPEAPNLLRATFGDGLVELEWRAPHDTGDMPLDGFRILRGTSDDGLAVITKVDTFTDAYEDTGLTNGVTYHYAIVAYNDLGDSPWSTVLNATPMGVPGAPMDLSALPGDGNVTFRWAAPLIDGGSPILGFRIYRGVNEFDMPLLIEVGVVTEVVDEGLTNGQEYLYTVLAFNDQGEGLRAVPISVTPLGLPGAPTGLDLVVGHMRFTLSWEPPVETGGTALTGFIIYRGESGDDLGLLEAMPASAGEYIDSDLVVLRHYYYAVAATTSAGEGPLSPVVDATPVDTPGVPDDLVVEAGDGEVVLTWTAPFDGGSPVTGYTIYRESDGVPETFEVGDVTTYTDATVVNGRTYRYSVHANNVLGAGQATDPVEATPFKPVFVPGQVTSLNTVAKGTKVTLTWTAPDDDGGSSLTGYIVLRGETPDAMTQVAQVGLVTSYVDEDVEAGKTYYYTVKAVNDVGQGDPVDPVQVKVDKVDVDEGGFPWVYILIAVVVVGGLAGAMMVMRSRQED